MQRTVSDRRALIKLFLGSALALGARSVAARASRSLDSFEFIDATPAFARLLKAPLEPVAAVAAYRAQIVEPNATPFGLIDPISDAEIGEYIARSIGKAGEIEQLGRQFPGYFLELWQRFDARFPLRARDTAVYLLPAPQDTLGGSVRFAGKRDLVILGAEVMAFAPKAGVAGAAFLHHELTHLYHQQQNRAMRDASRAYFAGNLRKPAQLHQILWLEGFAVFVSHTLNPTASLFDLLRVRDLEQQVSARRREIHALLRESFDSSDVSVIRSCVFDGSKDRGLPPKTGYYVGYLMARRLAEKHDIVALARMRGAELRHALIEAIDGTLSGVE